MSVKLEQIEFADEPDYSWLPDIESGFNPTEQDVLAMIRHILRERSDCKRIPMVLGAVQTEQVNQYGHNLFIHIQYTNRYQATYAGRVSDSGVSNVQCYMD